MSKWFRNALSWRSFRLLVVYSLIFLLSGFVGNIWMTRNQQSGQAPQVAAEDLSGHDVKLEFNQPHSKPTLLYFFAEWCPICKVQHSVISKINKDYQVLGIAMQSGDKASVNEYVLKQGIDFTVVNDESGGISRSFGVNGVPAAFIINKKGQIKYSTRGYATEAGLRSRLWLAKTD